MSSRQTRPVEPPLTPEEDASSRSPRDISSLRRRINDLRRRAAQPERRPFVSYLNQHRLRRMEEEDVTIATVQEAVDSLQHATEELNAALDEPWADLTPHEYVARLRPLEPWLESRQHKRRKLESAAELVEPRRYGHFGQVVPGKLDISLVDCDGGYVEREGVHPTGVRIPPYCPQNILRNDKSVFRANKSHCNIILRHKPGTTFSVTKMVIKIPDYGFSSPAQEGLIFVSMSADNLIRRTKRYRIIVPSQLNMTPNARGTGFTDNAGHEIPPHLQRQILALQPRDFSDNSPRRSRGSVFGGLGSVPGDEPEPDPSPSFHVTTSCEDPSDDDEEPTSPNILLDRQQRRNDYRDGTTDEGSDSSTSRQMPQRGALPRMYDFWPSSNPEKDREANGDLLKPHASFFIDRAKCVVTVKFDPPVTGRYILLKLWSPQNKDACDLESVCVYGYSGPRFLPSIKLK